MDSPIEPADAAVEVSRRKALLAEVAAISFCFVLPSLFGSNVTAVSASAREIGGSIIIVAELGIVLFVLWSSGDPMERFGLCRPRWIRDIPLGIVLAGIPYFISARVLWTPGVSALGGLFRHRTYGGNPVFVVETILFVIVSAALAELVYCGLLVPRLEELTRKAWLAILLSTTLFASSSVIKLIPMWEAWPYVTTVQRVWFPAEPVLRGLLFSLAFVRTRSLWPIVIGYSLFMLCFAFWIGL